MTLDDLERQKGTLVEKIVLRSPQKIVNEDNPYYQWQNVGQ